VPYYDFFAEGPGCGFGRTPADQVALSVITGRHTNIMLCARAYLSSHIEETGVRCVLFLMLPQQVGVIWCLKCNANFHGVRVAMIGMGSICLHSCCKSGGRFKLRHAAVTKQVARSLRLVGMWATIESIMYYSSSLDKSHASSEDSPYPKVIADEMRLSLVVHSAIMKDKSLCLP
jgi:hypothetical protein